jgi:hypothetical protein
LKPLRDVRTPADPQDFESLFDRPASPPLDFRVKSGVGGVVCTFEFKSFSGTPERDPTVEYRAYFVPMSVGTREQLGTPQRRKAAMNMGRLCCSVTPSGRGEWITFSTPDYTTALGGWFLAVGVNRRGVESEPTLAFPSPFNP